MKTVAFVKWPGLFAKIAGAGVFLAGMLVFMGWCFHILRLTSICPDWPKMSPLATLGFMLGGLSLGFNTQSVPKKKKLIDGSQICAAMILLIGLFRLSDYRFGWDLNLDMLGCRDATGLTSPVLLSPTGALCFLLLGSALLLAGSSRSIIVFHFLILLALLIGWLGLVSYFFNGVPALAYAALPMNSALLFLLLGAGILCTRTDGGLVALLISESVGGLITRRILVPAILTPLVLNWLELEANRHGWLAPQLEALVFMASDIITIGSLLWFNAVLLHRMDVKRGHAEEARAQLASIIEASNDAIIRRMPDGVITSWNRSAEKIFGYSAQEAIGRPLNLSCPSGQPGGERDFWARGETVENLETLQLRKDKKPIYVSLTKKPLTDSLGKIVGSFRIANDITQRRKLEEQFRQSQKMEGVGLLAGGIAHDFNNVLAVIQMQAELLRRAGLTPGQIEITNEIWAATQRAAGLTRQLLLFTRKETLLPRDLDLSQSIKDMSKMLLRIVGEDIQMQTKLTAQSLLIRADAGMLDQALLNLAVNARDAMPKGGKLIIETSIAEFDGSVCEQFPQARPGEFACLSVSDTGCGIPPENLKIIFEPFFTTKEAGKGTGLGLATVAGIVQQHQGWMNVYSEVGQGTTFRIYLPRLLNPTGQKSTPATTPTTPVGSSHETILFVEDDDFLRAAVRKVLSQHGYLVLEACNAVAALKIWQRHGDKIHLLLTDLVMPGGMSGQELGEQLSQQNANLKVIYFSGYSADIAGKDIPLEEGFNYLTKPFQAQRLVQIIRHRLEVQLVAA